jgi:2-polyprenyl-3-methyl-5-hydroxy-6-metoxy-1,4-benzoquinol methylase
MSYSKALKTVEELTRKVETLAALGALFGAIGGDSKAAEVVAVKLQSVQEAIDPNLLDEITEVEARFLQATVRANLRRALDLIENPDQPATWGFDDPIILQAQGKASRIVAQRINEFADRDQALFERLKKPGYFLDVGSGVGWISITMAESWPALKIDGIDIHEPALKLAEQNRTKSSVANRIQFHNRNVADIENRDQYAAVFIPIIFIPESVIESSLPVLHRAIEPDGWLFVATFRIPQTPLARALNDLQTTLWGGKVWTEDGAANLLSRHGFELVEDIGVDTRLNLFAARKISFS